MLILFSEKRFWKKVLAISFQWAWWPDLVLIIYGNEIILKVKLLGLVSRIIDVGITLIRVLLVYV
jgi:hypothetical protein